MKTGTTHMSPATTRLSWAQVAVLLGGLFYILTGLALLFAPAWFYEHIGNFPPFNRHYSGDLGAFLLPLGVALLWAARQPAVHSLTISLAAVASLLHALNHAYDDWTAGSPLAHWFGETIPTFLFALLLLAAYWHVVRQHNNRPAG